jgi:hypothetical protein
MISYFAITQVVTRTIKAFGEAISTDPSDPLFIPRLDVATAYVTEDCRLLDRQDDSKRPPGL